MQSPLRDQEAYTAAPSAALAAPPAHSGRGRGLAVLVALARFRFSRSVTPTIYTVLFECDCNLRELFVLINDSRVQIRADVALDYI